MNKPRTSLEKKLTTTQALKMERELQEVETAFSREYARYELAFHRLATM